MEILGYWLLYSLVFFGDIAGDPANVAWQGRTAARQFECERISHAEGHERFPGTVPAPSARGMVQYDIDALVCDRRILADDARSPRDELILRELESEIAELVGLATKPDTDPARRALGKPGAAVVEDAPPTRWTVDAFYPDLTMTRKIASAARVSLAERGQVVSDLPPLFTAGDVEVFRSLRMRDAIPLACKRLFDTKALNDNDAFLAIALLHEKESQLHAGTCRKGEFTWLR